MVPKVGKVTVGVGSAVGLLLLILGYFEGSNPVVYNDPVGIPTVCVGHTDQTLVVGQRKSSEQCLALLNADLQVAWHTVSRLVKVPIDTWEQMAYASFVFNVGASAFEHSTMLKKLNSGDHVGACMELPKWVYSKGKKLPGLVKRREFEKELCLGHDVQLGK